MHLNRICRSGFFCAGSFFSTFDAKPDAVFAASAGAAATSAGAGMSPGLAAGAGAAAAAAFAGAGLAAVVAVFQRPSWQPV